MPAPIDISGKRFGRLLTRNRLPGGIWECVCDCGMAARVTTNRLRSGNTTSCGCRKRSVLGESTTRHGMAGTRTHRIWKAMKTRCLNKNAPRHKDYAHLSVCRRWLKFENFLADMGVCPDGFSLERKDNTKGYTPSNCRWALPHDQNVNKKNSLHVDGLPLRDWALLVGVSYWTAYNWHHNGLIGPSGTNVHFELE